MKSLRYIVSHCLQVVMNAAQHETGRNGGMRSAFRFLGFIVNGLLLVALSLGLFTRWEHSGDTNLLVMFVMGLVVFLIACVLSYYFSMENACTNIAHLVFGFLLGFLALVDQANLIDDSKEEASRYLLLLSIFTRPMLSISSRFFRATRFASTLLLSTEFLELVGFGAASAALTMERCFDVSLLLCAFGLCLADLRMKSLLALPTMIGFSVISVLLFFPALDLSINPFALGCFFGRLLCDPLIDLFYSGLTVTERWHPYLQAHKMLRRFSVLILLLAELLFIILSAFTLGNVNRWYILRLLGIIVFGILWVTSHLVLVTALWAFHNRLNNCLGACALLRTGSKSLDDVMASRGMRQYCLVAEQLVFGALIFTILMAVVCWQEKNGTFIALFMFILPLESLVFGLFHELGSCLGGTCIGYSLIIPTAYCSPDKQPMPLPPELVETINLRATTMLHAIQRFFARYMVENFGCDYSTSGVNLDNLQGKLRTFFDQRTDDGARHDTYILHYSGHTHNSGEWALAVVCSFSGALPYGLPVEVGDTVQILERCNEWYRGFNTKASDLKGVFPVSHVWLKKATVDNRGQYETVTPVEDPTVTEVTITLREWGTLWKQLYLQSRGDLFHRLRHVMQELFDMRRQILAGQLTADQLRDAKRHATARLDWGNEQLGLDLVPRSDYEMVDPDQISVTELYKLHASSRHNALQSLARSESRLGRSLQPVWPTSSTHHLSLVLRSFSCNVFGDEAEVFFFLYDARLSSPISERFLVRLNRNGLPKSHERADRLCALFTDLGSGDVRQDVYLVAHVLRIGRMVADSRKAASGAAYRRPFGCAVLSAAELLHGDSDRQRDEREFVLKVFTCSNESEWHQMHENIVKKSNTKYYPASSNYGILVALQLFYGDLDQVRRENPYIFTRGLALTRKLGFSEVIMPGDMRNEMFITLERGEFEKGGKSVQKNVEVTMYVLDVQGDILPDCICAGSGEPGVTKFRSFVLYHNNSPRWAEPIKLPLPIERFRGAHLRFEFRHCSTKDKGERKLFAFSFTPLMHEDGSTLTDTLHELLVYKCDESLDLSNPSIYLCLRSSKDHQNGAQTTPASLNGPVQLSARESFFISTILCSTKLTQNGVLLGLLKWKANSNQLVDILPQLRHMHGGEIVKFLQDILDTLFAILDESPEKYSTLVFQALVHIINLLRDAKFHNFRPVMDMYIQKHFAGALAYRELLRCLQWYLDRSVGAERQDSLQEALKALEYLFKFVVQSRRLFVQATGGRDEEDFRGSICAFFHSVQCCLAQESKGADTVAYTQAAFLGSFPAVYGELMRLLGPREVAGLVRDTLGSLPGLLHVAQVLRGAQLQCVGQTVQSQLFACPEARRVLLPVVLRYLHSHLQHQQELPLCASILGTLFSIIKRDSTALLPVSDELDLLAATLPEVLVCILVELLGRSHSSTNHRASHEATNIVGEYVSCLLSLLRQMADTHFQQLLESFGNREHLREFLQQIFRVFQYLLQPDIYPRDWMAMRTVTNNVIITTMQYLSSALHTHFVNDSFDFKVWSSYFTLAVMFINQPSLQLEKFSPAKRKKMLDRYGDMRVMMGYEIFSMWQNLAEHKMHFIPGMIGPFLGVTLVPQAELRSVMIPIFHDMIDWEQRRYGSLKQVEAELVDKLDSLVAEGKGDENYRELFSLLLLEKIEQETWRESGISFVTSVTRLMERLLDYRDCMTGGDVEDKKIGCTVNLLNFYKNEINKEEMYIRYIHKLFDLHRQANNSTEAAFALSLYAEQLTWDERPLQEILHYPSQMERQRRELLYLEIIHYFDLGKSWENAIHLCQELAALYQARYDYRRLSKIRKMEAGFYDNIMEQQRLEPEFFRIGFYGRKFPFFLRNKEFVCRGHDYERLEAFQQRMLSEFPQAVAMQNANTPDESVLNSDAQQLQIYAVTPVPRNLDVLQANFVPDCVKFHYRTHGVRRFRYDRPFHRGPRDKDNEFKSLWIERTTLILTRSLPGISRWFEVESRDVVFVSPLENAIQALENKAQELRSLVSQYQIQEREQGGQPGTLTSIQPLSMSLNGVIDAAVNGGISRYQEAFFLKDYVESHPEDWDRIVRLRELMHEQVHILREGLSVHDKLVTQDMRPLHNKLLEQFQVMQNSLMEKDSVWQARMPCGFHSHSVSPDLLKHLNRHSPMNLMGLVRHSGSSLSSQTSTDAGGIFWMSDSTGGDGSDECFSHKMQASPSTGSLVSIQSAPGHVFSAAPYNNHASPLFGDPRGSLALPSSLLLLPKERPASALYPPTYERKQMNLQQSLLQQVRGPGKPNSDPNLSTGDRAVTPAPSSWSLDGHSREHCILPQSHSPIPLPVQRLPLTPVSPPVPPRTGDQGNEQVTNLTARPMRKMPLQPIPASPTETHTSHSHRPPSRALTRSPSCCSSPLPSSDYAVYTTHAQGGYRKHGCRNAPEMTATPLRRSGGLNAHEVDRHRRDYVPQAPSRFGLSELARDRSPSSPANCPSQPCRSISLPLGGNAASDAVPPPALPPKPRGSRRASDGGWNEDGMPIPLPRKLSQVGERGKT